MKVFPTDEAISWLKLIITIPVSYMYLTLFPPSFLSNLSLPSPSISLHSLVCVSNSQQPLLHTFKCLVRVMKTHFPGIAEVERYVAVRAALAEGPHIMRKLATYNPWSFTIRFGNQD